MREALAAARAPGGGSLRALAARDAAARLRAHLRQLDAEGAPAEWAAAATPAAPLDAALADVRALAEELAALPM